jgi:DNA-binding GntR family transcriptional regulator
MLTMALPRLWGRPPRAAERADWVPTDEPATLRTLPARVYHDLRKRILHQELPPGTPVRIRDICEYYDVSATPVREALRLLEADGLVLHRPYQGTVVTALDFEVTIASLEARLALELYAVGKGLTHLADEEIERLADLADRLEALSGDGFQEHIDEVLELDDRFHSVLVGLARNPVINDLYHSLHIHTYVARALLPARGMGNTNEHPDEHHEILRLCVMGDPTLLKDAIRRHVGEVQDNLRIAARQANESIANA